MGNICRSPTAHGVFDEMVRTYGMEDVFHIDSAGTHASHVGTKPDPRAREVAKSNGYDISYVRARGLSERDYTDFDYLLAMDRSNLSSLQLKSPLNTRDKLELFLDFHPEKVGEDVPDPYLRDTELFVTVFELVEQGCKHLLKTIRNRHQL